KDAMASETGSSQLLAQSGVLLRRARSVAFGAKRTFRERRERTDLTRLNQSGNGRRFVLRRMFAFAREPDIDTSRCFDDLLARGGQPGQRQNRSQFARRRVQLRFLEPGV